MTQSEGSRDSQRVNVVEQCASLEREGQVYKSFVSWFNLPKDKREEAIKDTLTRVAKKDQSLRDIKRGYVSLSLQDQFIFNNFEILSSDDARKILLPQGLTEITDKDLNSLSNNERETAARFNRILKDNNIDSDYSADEYDFKEVSKLISSKFSVEEEREFLKQLLPLFKKGSEMYKIAKSTSSLRSFINPFRHIELIFDDILGKYLEKQLIGDTNWQNYLENYLSQGVFPSPEFFEEVFRRKPLDCDPNAIYTIHTREGDKEVPASLHYFSILRRINHVTGIESSPNPKDEFTVRDEKNRDIVRDPKKIKEIKERIVGYLLSDEFMRRVLPYLNTDKVYGNEWDEDRFISSTAGYIDYGAEIEATGDKAREIKKQRFSEVLREAIIYLKGIGNQVRIQKIQDRQVDGVKFSDFLAFEK